MATKLDFDPAVLVAPIAGEHPTGIDLRGDTPRKADFRALRDAREEARRAERKADLDGEPPSQSLPLWRKVIEAGQKLLAEDSKDLEVTAFLIEALIRTDGFAGLRVGFRTARELIENFWDGLYPEPDEEGIATRVLPLARLNGVESEGLIIAPIQRIPVTEGVSVGPFACWHYRQATELTKYTDREREERIARGAVTPEKFAQAISETDTQFLRDLVEDIEGCLAEFDALSAVLVEKCGVEHAPPSSAIRETLESCLETVRHSAGNRLLVRGDSDNNSSQSGSSPGRTSGGTGAVSDREQAFQTLNTVADFFDRTEPLSLLGDQIRKIVRLGRMSPAEYYTELIEDATVREQLFKMVGIRAPNSNSSGE
jgi:type VI secretion system protein ImpA